MLLSCFASVSSAEEPAPVDLMDSLTVIDSGTKIGDCDTQSAFQGNGEIDFNGPGATGGDRYTRALCKINDDEGVDLTGYTNIYVDIAFNNVIPTDLFRTSFRMGDATQLEVLRAVDVYNTVTGEKVNVSATKEDDGVTGITAYSIPESFGTEFTLTFKVKIRSNIVDTVANRFYVYPSGWNGIKSGTFKLTSVRLGGDTDPGVNMSARFVSVLRDEDVAKYSQVGFEVTAALGNASSTQVLFGNTVYTSLIGAGVEYTPDLFGGSYFAALRIDNIPAKEGLAFTVKAFVKTIDGEIIYAEPVTYTVAADGTIS